MTETICRQILHLLASELFDCPTTLTQALNNLSKSEIMAPHADDLTFDPKTPAQNKVLPTNGDTQAHTASGASVQEHAVAGSNGEVKETRESTNDASPRPPLQLKGVLNDFESFDVTPVIGREFPEAKLAEWLRAPNSDELIRDLAITSSFSSHHTTE